MPFFSKHLLLALSASESERECARPRSISVLWQSPFTHALQLFESRTKSIELHHWGYICNCSTLNGAAEERDGADCVCCANKIGKCTSLRKDVNEMKAGPGSLCRSISEFEVVGSLIFVFCRWQVRAHHSLVARCRHPELNLLSRRAISDVSIDFLLDCGNGVLRVVAMRRRVRNLASD